MVRFILLGLLPLGLAGCSQWPGSVPGWRDAAAAGHYDFNWQLSGDPAVAPLQVFSGAGRTWLQFAPGRTPPAVFAQTGAGLQPLVYSRREPYVVVDGIWPILVLRGGQHTARAERQGSSVQSGARGSPTSLPGVFAATERTAPEGLQAASAEPQMPASAALISDIAPAAVPAAGAPVFRARLADGTLRAVLARWAGQSGWTFEPQHWALEVDIPLAGEAEFPTDFKSAVRQLLASTELADRPLQPCFYANKVLRVVPATQACDRSAATGGRS